MLERARAAEGFEQLEHCALLRSASKCFFAMGKRGKIFAQVNYTMSLPRGLWLRGTGERSRKRGAQGDSDGDDVVVGHPPAERDHVPAQCGSFIRNFDYTLE